MKRVMRLLIALLALPAIAWATIVTPEVTIVDPTADLQAAVDATASGDVLDLGAGKWSLDSVLVIDHPMTLRGSSRDPVNGTIIRPYQADADDPDADAAGIKITSPDVVIESLCVANENQPAASGTGYGIWIAASSYADTLPRVTVRDVTVQNMGGYGVYAAGASGSPIVGLMIENLHAERNNSNSVRLASCIGAAIVGLYAYGNTSNSVTSDAAYYYLTSVSP